jgi:hypothetical protein
LPRQLIQEPVAHRPWRKTLRAAKGELRRLFGQQKPRSGALAK